LFHRDYPDDPQDLASRFTLDSATEFLFGRDVLTLSAGLPYPASSPLANSPAFLSHSSNKFVKAFMSGQLLSARRTRFGPTWPMTEFWVDKIKPHRKIINEFIQPILTEAMTRRGSKVQKPDANPAQEDGNDETLLSHLVRHTQGSFSFQGNIQY
jgi:hypothetical protein